MIKYIAFSELTLNYPCEDYITKSMIEQHFLDSFSDFVKEKMKIETTRDTPNSITQRAEIVIMSSDELRRALADARTEGFEYASRLVPPNESL